MSPVSEYSFLLLVSAVTSGLWMLEGRSTNWHNMCSKTIFKVKWLIGKTQIKPAPNKISSYAFLNNYQKEITISRKQVTIILIAYLISLTKYSARNGFIFAYTFYHGGKGMAKSHGYRFNDLTAVRCLGTLTVLAYKRDNKWGAATKVPERRLDLTRPCI